jgi:hypothetical protein
MLRIVSFFIKFKINFFYLIQLILFEYKNLYNMKKKERINNKKNIKDLTKKFFKLKIYLI